jgi:hypothetical protein
MLDQRLQPADHQGDGEHGQGDHSGVQQPGALYDIEPALHDHDRHQPGDGGRGN